MLKIGQVMAVFVFLGLAAGVAQANEGLCTNPLATKIADECDPTIGVQGCCVNDRIVWCEADGSAQCFLDCASSNLACGWEPTHGAYSCGPVAAADPSGTFPRECTWSCTGSCEGRECGTDGCFGYCGACPSGKPACGAEGLCGECVPSCGLRECGDDGCGGSCGTCPDGHACLSDGTCCTGDCTGIECGDDGCGGSCGTCADGSACDWDGVCHVCSCEGKACGDDGCGNPCGTCADGQACDATGQCVDAQPGCVATNQPGCDGCACEACVCALDDLCCTLGWDDLCVAECAYECGGGCGCVPDCTDRDCGDDGCGGTCGACAEGSVCGDAGLCEACTCEGRQCGDDGCGGSCGTCGEGEVCASSQCVTSGCAVTLKAGCDDCGCEACVCALHPHCCTNQWDAECAAACGDNCGQACPCVADCGGAVCGSDGCGGSCGTCDAGATCVAGECLACEPYCEGKECGDDGCGGSCGTCAAGSLCSDGACFAEYPASCLGPDRPSGTACPAGMTEIGCCDDQTRVVWCEGGTLYCSECPGSGGQEPACGWGGVYYQCGVDGEDPSGVHPWACTCTPSCHDRECGSDGCGGSCGTCDAGVECAQGRCTVPVPDDVPVDAYETMADGTVADLADSGPQVDTVAAPDNAAEVAPSEDVAGPVVEAKGGGGGGGCRAGAAPDRGTPALFLAFLAIALLVVRRRSARAAGGRLGRPGREA